jgi:tRNA A37 threonylcarbamoyladenosine dehydratase
MQGLLERTHILLGDEKIARLQNARVFIAGLGGVGSFAAEALARMGVGNLTLVDCDVVAASNINRQLVALNSTVGQKKADVMAERVRDINPDIKLTLISEFMNRESFEAHFAQNSYDYVLDCIDSLNCKVALIEVAYKLGLNVASSMGAGGKTDPSQIKVSDIYDTNVCHLASKIRQRLKRVEVGTGVRTVYSTEPPLPPLPPEPTSTGRPRAVNGTVSYMPPLFGFTLAGLVVRDLTGITQPLKRKQIRKGYKPKGMT